MRRPEVELALAADGTYLAYQCFGSGPIDIFWQNDTFAMVDHVWDSPPELAWLEGLVEFARVIFYDKRGMGLSSRNVAPGNLETQAADVLTVLDALDIDQVVLGGVLEAGAPNVLLAASHPTRVQSLVWVYPTPRTTTTVDYPWGVNPEYVERELASLEWWGTPRWVEEFYELNADILRGPWATDEYRRFILRSSLRTCTPDVQTELCRIWYDTDVRAALSSIQAPTLLMTSVDNDLLALAGSVAAKIPRAEIVSMPDFFADADGFAAAHAAIRQFVGVERPLIGMDSVLATVLFTDIVDSTKMAAHMGDAAWNNLLAGHDEAAKAQVERYRGRFIHTTGDGLLATFDGPARAVRCAQAIGETVGDMGLKIRAGCHTGEIELAGDDIHGIAVHIGARVASLAGASEVWVSSTVKDLVAGSGLTFEDAGEHNLKGVPDRWRLHRVVG